MAFIPFNRLSPSRPMSQKTCFIAATMFVMLGCEPTGPTSTTSGDTSSTSTSSGSSSGNPNGLCGGTGAPPSVYEPLPSVPACAAPTATKTLEKSMGYFASPALASCGGLIGFAYSSGQANITFQALDLAGIPIGDPILVANPANSSVPKISIASNRKTFMVCWSDWISPSSLQCGVVDPDQRSVTVGNPIVGSAVDVSWGAGGYMVVYKDPDTNAIKAHRLGEDGSFVGDPIDVGAPATLRPEVAPQGANFTYVAPNVFGEIDGVTLQPTVAPNLATGINDAIFQHIAATPKASAILQRSQASVVVAGTTQNTPLVDLGTTPGAVLYVGVAAADASFAAVWGAGGVLRYRAFDDDSQTIGPNEVDLFDDGINFNGVAIVETNDGFIVAGSHAQNFSVAHVACP